MNRAGARQTLQIGTNSEIVGRRSSAYLFECMCASADVGYNLLWNGLGLRRMECVCATFNANTPQPNCSFSGSDSRGDLTTSERDTLWFSG